VREVSIFAESKVEDAGLAWLGNAGWRVAHSPDIAPDMPVAERADYGEVVLARRLRDVLARLNPELPAEAIEQCRSQAEPVPLRLAGPGSAGNRTGGRPKSGAAICRRSLLPRSAAWRSTGWSERGSPSTSSAW